MVRRTGTRLRRYIGAVAIAAPLCLIAPAALAQVANDDNYTVEQDSRNNRFDVLANDAVATDSAFIVAVSQPSQGGEVTLNRNRREIRYTPREGFTGTETFRYTLFAGGFWSAQVTVQVIGGNGSPNAVDDRYETSANTRLDVSAAAGVLRNDSDPEGDALTVTLSDEARDGDVTLRPDGSFTYVPDANFTGEDRFRYVVRDGRGGSDEATVRIAVENRNAAPIVSPVPDQTAYVGTRFELDLGPYVSDGDTPSTSLRFAALSSYPADLTISPLGLIAGTPAGGSVGLHVLRFSVSDGFSTVDGRVTLVIEETPLADLGIGLEADPNPVPVGTQARWLLSVTNKSAVTADAVSVEGRFTGSAPFEFDPLALPGCTVAPDLTDITVSCTFATLEAGATTSIELTGSGPAAGDVLGLFAARSNDRADADPRDNGIVSALSIATSINRESAQTLAGQTANALAAGDISGDGFVDLVAATNDGVRLYLNIPDPANPRKRVIDDTPVTPGGTAAETAIALADLDGDGDLDIVAAGAAGQAVRVYLNVGGLEFTQAEPFAAAVAIRAVAAADIDGDGFVDLVLAGNGANLLSRGTGVPGDFAAPATFGNAAAVDVALVDLFGDARPEMAFANADGDASIYSFDAIVSLAATLPSGPTTSIIASDFSGDGASDLLFGRDSASGSLTTPSNPLFLNFSVLEPAFTESAGLGAAPTFSVLASDTDADSYTDAIVLNRSGAHQVFKNTGGGDGTFLLAPAQLAAVNTGGATNGRFSVDGREDLAIAGADGIAIYLGDGLGGFGIGDVTPPTITLVGGPTVRLPVGETFVDPGATAVDSADGDVSAGLTVTGEVDAALLGNYVITYEVADTSGNTALATRTVEVTARTPVGGGGGGAVGITLILLLLTLSLIARLKSEDEDN